MPLECLAITWAPNKKSTSDLIEIEFINFSALAADAFCSHGPCWLEKRHQIHDLQGSCRSLVCRVISPVCFCLFFRLPSFAEIVVSSFSLRSQGVAFDWWISNVLVSGFGNLESLVSGLRWAVSWRRLSLTSLVVWIVIVWVLGLVVN